MRPRKTKIRKKGKGFEISFSEKDGKALAAHLNNGGSIRNFSCPYHYTLACNICAHDLVCRYRIA